MTDMDESPSGLPALFTGISVADYKAAQEW
jgi:hypothetical protein